MKVAVFDVCGTLYDANTTSEFIAYYLRKKRRPRYWILQVSRARIMTPIWLALQRLVARDIFRELTIRLLGNESEQAVRAEVSGFVQGVLRRRKKHATMKLLAELKQQGYKIVLASGSLSIVVEAIAVEVEAEVTLACSLEEIGPKLTGRYSHDIAGRKDEIVRQRFPTCSDLVVVTDNREDAKLLEMASTKIVVCPVSRRWRWCGHLPEGSRFVE